MNWPKELPIAVGQVSVGTSSNGPMPPDFWAERIVDRLIYIGDDAPEPLKQQAWAYRDKMKAVVLSGLMRAIKSDRAYRPFKE
jgi:hypothetical protein